MVFSSFQSPCPQSTLYIPFIKEDIYVPENSETINIQLGQIANNYAWYDENSTTIVQGDYYQYRRDGEKWTNIESGDKLHWKQMISSIEVGRKPVTYDVRAKDHRLGRG